MSQEGYRILKAYDGLQAVEMLEREDVPVSYTHLQNQCCKRAYIRGAFLASGSMSDPEKGYHFEIVCSTEEKAEKLQEMLTGFGIDARITLRKRSFVLYVKEGSQIVDLLNVMEAHVALMKFENVRILKEMRNSCLLYTSRCV